MSLFAPDTGHERQLWGAASLALMLLALGLYVLDLGAQSLWMDEVITVQRSSMSLPGVMRDLFETRNHVPLYFIMMHVWQKGGMGEFWVRFPSVMWAVLGVAMTVRLGREVGGRRVGLLAGLLLACAPLYNWHAQDARMYSMAAFWVVSATWVLFRAWSSNRWGWWALYGLCVWMAAYTHLLAPVVFLGQAFLVILRRWRNRTGFRRWFVVMALVGMLYLPWLMALVNSGGFSTAYTGWIPTPGLLDLPLTYYVLSVGATAGWHNVLTYVPLALVVALTVWLISRMRTIEDSRRWKQSVTAVGIALMPPVVWLASFRQSVYVDRYFLPLVPMLAVWVGAGLDLVWMRRRVLSWAALALLLFFDAWSLANMHYSPRYARDDWRGAAAYIRARAMPSDVLLAYADRPFDYYSPGDLVPHDAWPIMADAASYAGRTATIIEGKERLWLVLPLTVLNNHAFCEERDRLAVDWVDENPYVQWLLAQYSLIDAHRVPGIHVMLFEVG